MRLNVGIKSGIIRRESEKKFGEKIKAAQDAFEVQLEDDAQKNRKKENPLIPQGLIDANYIRVTNTCYVLGLGKDTGRKYLRSSYPVTINSNKFEFNASTKLVRAEEKVSRLRTEKNQFEVKMRRVLNSFTTSKKLLINVPELAEYFKDEIKTNSMTLIPIEQINEVRKLLKGK